jgi:pyridoxine 5-phosphate synthase
MIRLGVNVDHVATVRQARGEPYPDPVQAAVMAELGGADNITAHLREDRRHMQDRDIPLLKATIGVPLNFEMGATAEMVEIALTVKPHAVTLVPEKREERTTEGGLDLSAPSKALTDAIKRLSAAGIVVSLFVEPELKAVQASAKLGAHAVEFHTGRFCQDMARTRITKDQYALVKPLAAVAKATRQAGMQAHFGHGLNYTNAQWLQLVEDAEEANIGHAIIARALFIGLAPAVAEMKRLLNDPAARPRLP